MTWTRLALLSLILGPIALWLLANGIAALREARIEAAYPPAGQILRVEGVAVHAQVMGDGPDLVLLHGANGNLREFQLGLAQTLSERYRVVLLDRPGLGYTGRTGGHGGLFAPAAETPAEQAALLKAATDQLGLQRPIVVGQSFGGAVALAWALEHDPAALVMVSGVSNPWPGDLGWIYTVNGTSLGGALIVPFITAFVPDARLRRAADAVFAPQDPPTGYFARAGIPLSIRREAFRANARQVNRLRPHIVEMSQRYGDLALPVEILHGDADDTVPLRIHSEPLSRQIPQAQLTILPGVGHMPHHTNRADVIAAIDRAAARAGLR